MAFPVDNLAQQQEAVRQAHLRHANGRSILGRFQNAYQLWRTLYEARAALADANPTFAAYLLPANAPLAGPALGFPAIPTGVYWQVDKTSPGTVDLAVEIAGTVTVQVTPPDGSAAQTPAVTPTPARQSTNFVARTDGLYAVNILVGGTTLTTLYVPVMRARFLDFRELSRFLAFAFKRDRQPAATDAYNDLYVTLIGADAAAATGNTALFVRAVEIAAELPKAPTPTALSWNHA